MKKKLSVPTIIVSAVLAAIVIAIVVLICIPTKTVATAVAGYDNVVIYSANAEYEIGVGNREDDKAKLDEAIDESFFSVMQGILEGKVGGEGAYKMETKDGEASESKVEIAANEITSIAASEGKYKLEFRYTEAKTVEVDGDKISYDRAIVIFGDSNNEIGEVEITYYLHDNVGNELSNDDDNASENYVVTPVIYKARTTKMYNAVKDIIANWA